MRDQLQDTVQQSAVHNMIKDTYKISINDLLLRSYIGFQEWEKNKLQDLLIQIDLYVNESALYYNDSPSQCVNYKNISKAVIDLINESHFNLLESFIVKVVALILSADSR